MAKASSKTKGKPSKQKVPATAPVAAVSPGGKLGLKRTCPKCSTKFYDFCKEELNCPKCNSKLKASQLVSVPNIPRAEPKKAKVPEKISPDALSPDESGPEVASDAFESVDDLDDDDKVVEELGVDDDEDDKDDY